MATIQDFEERIEKQKAELAKLEAKKKGTLSDAPWFLCPNSSQSPDTPAYLLRTHARLAHCNSLSSCEPCTGRNTW